MKKLSNVMSIFNQSYFWGGLHFVFLFFGCSAQVMTQTEDISFSKELWVSDTLGSKGYRSKILEKDNFIENLIGKTQNEIDKLLGVPDFICDSQEETIYQYNFEYKRFSNHIEYDYKPKSDCNKNVGLGSFLSIIFDTSGKVSVLPLVVHKGG